jgi:hypothetical protein
VTEPGATSEDNRLVAAPGSQNLGVVGLSANKLEEAAKGPVPGDLVMGTPPTGPRATTQSSPSGAGATAGDPSTWASALQSFGPQIGPHNTPGVVGGGLLALGNGIYRRLPSELSQARVMVPAVITTVLASLASVTAAKVFAGIWGLALALSIIARTSAKKGSETSPAACSYWSAFGLACAAPADAALALGAGLLIWTSARPGHEWLPWRMLYGRLTGARLAVLDKLAATAIAAVPATALGGVLLLWLIPAVGKGFAWFAGFGLAAVLLLALTTAGEAVPATRAIGKVALVLAIFGFGCISDLRFALVGAMALLAVVLFMIEPRRSSEAGHER